MTDKVPGLVEGLILKPATNGRCTYSKIAKQALVELCKQPGVSVAALALAHGINANLLRRWVNLHAVGGRHQPRAALLPVTTPPLSAPGPAPTSSGCIEIGFKGATIRVRGAVDVQALSAVLDCLAQRV
jgi:transposase